MLVVKLVMKLVVLPVLLAVRMIEALLYGMAWLAAHIAGPLLFCMAGFAIYYACLREWTDVAILSAVCCLVYGAFLGSGILIAFVQMIGDGITGFLWS